MHPNPAILQYGSASALVRAEAPVDELALDLVKTGVCVSWAVKVLVGTIQRARAATCSVRVLTFMN